MQEQVVSIILYDSVARGTNTEDSDVDAALLIKGELNPATEDRNFEMYQIEMDKRCVHESIGHSSNSSEYVMVLEGQMILDVNGCEYQLEADDALYFDASYPHVYKNKSGKRVKAVLIIYYI